ncbi:MAG: helix-turn-helix domain-containing protein [Pseudomonadota bacterium]
MKEKIKLEVVQRVMDGQVNIEQAAAVLRRNIRTIYRMLSRVRRRGIEGIVHRNRGNKHACKMDDKMKEKIKGLATSKYQGFNDTHMAEKFCENEGQ